jgi:hypothetical protein
MGLDGLVPIIPSLPLYHRANSHRRSCGGLRPSSSFLELKFALSFWGKCYLSLLNQNRVLCGYETKLGKVEARRFLSRNEIL